MEKDKSDNMNENEENMNEDTKSIHDESLSLSSSNLYACAKNDENNSCKRCNDPEKFEKEKYFCINVT